MIVGVGVDIVDIARMKLAVERNKNIIYKILTKSELEQLPNLDILSERFLESLSARFAAKEAFVKSMGLSLFSVGIQNIEILKPSGSDKPQIGFSPVCEVAHEGEGFLFHLSISHSNTSAIATVIAESKD